MERDNRSDAASDSLGGDKRNRSGARNPGTPASSRGPRSRPALGAGRRRRKDCRSRRRIDNGGRSYRHPQNGSWKNPILDGRSIPTPLGLLGQDRGLVKPEKLWPTVRIVEIASGERPKGVAADHGYVYHGLRLSVARRSGRNDRDHRAFRLPSRRRCIPTQVVGYASTSDGRRPSSSREVSTT